VEAEAVPEGAVLEVIVGISVVVIVHVPETRAPTETEAVVVVPPRLDEVC
jgi:hypothetical protein